MWNDLTPAQRRAAGTRGTNLLVEAAPGSGKTQVVVERCAGLVREGVGPEQILLLTFSRRAVGELRARLAARFAAGVPLPGVRTFHGFASRLLAVEGAAFRNRRLLSAPAEAALFAEAVRRTELTGFPKEVVHSERFLRDAQLRVAELGRAGADAVAAFERVAGAKVRDLVAIARQVRELRDDLAVADYDDLVGRAVRLAADTSSSVHQWLQGRYAHVLVDEFQDSNPLHLALLRHTGGEIFAIGDAAQALYGFRGAARQAIEEASRALEMRRITLHESFRCAQAICNLAAATPYLPPHAAPISLGTMPGTVEYRQAATPLDEASLIGERVADAIARDRRPASTIGVLLRTYAPLGPLVAAELESRGIPVMQTGGMLLLHDPIVDAILAGLEVLQKPGNLDAWTRLLALPAFGHSPLQMRLAFEGGTGAGIEAVAHALSAANLKGRLEPARFAETFREALALWNADEPVRAARKLARGWDLSGWLIASERDENGVRASSARLKSFLAGFADLQAVRRDLGLPGGSAATLDALIENAARWTDEGDDGAPADAVRMLTIRAAKGLEFDYTIVGDAAEGRLPQELRRDTMARDSEIALARTLGIDLSTTESEHAGEEASLWYVAITRAKTRLTITCAANGMDGAVQLPSRFIPREVAERFENEPPYRAALTYRPAAEPRFLEPQIPVPIALPHYVAATGIDTWLACKRRFYYKNVLKLSDAEMPPNVTTGNVLHAVLERFHADERDFSHVADADAERWEGRLLELRASVWGDSAQDLGTALQAMAAARRADRLLSAYAHSLAQLASEAPFTVVETERTHRFELHGIEIIGRIDRVDRLADDSLAIRDYKTSGLDATLRDAIASLAGAAESGRVWVKALKKRLYAQLALYRHAPDLPNTRRVSYIYLDGKKERRKSTVTPVEIDTLEEGEALASLDALLKTLFFDVWRAEVLELKPTENAAECSLCGFAQLCPGAAAGEA